MNLTEAEKPLIVQKVEAFEQELMKLDPVEFEVGHYFVPPSKEGSGLYGRPIYLPAGAMLTGRVHKFPQLNIVSKGRIAVLTADGLKEFSAGDHIVSPAGVKRAAYAFEDTVWTTIIATNHTEIDTIEDKLTTFSYSEFIEYTRTLEDKS